MKEFDFSKSDTPEFYNLHGFALFKGIFSSDEISFIRKHLIAQFSNISDFPDDREWNEKGSFPQVRYDYFNRYQELRWILFKPEVKKALKTVLGDYAILTESVAHHEGFGNWHKDTTSQEVAGETFHYEPNYNMVQCAIYLQDNDPLFGGGLDLIPGSHKDINDIFAHQAKNSIVEKIKNRYHQFTAQKGSTKKRLQVPSKAGDFVIFNKKTTHRATPCLQHSKPADKSKYALFFLSGTMNQHLHSYTNFTKKKYSYMDNYLINEDFMEECSKNNVSLILPDVS